MIIQCRVNAEIAPQGLAHTCHLKGHKENFRSSVFGKNRLIHFWGIAIFLNLMDLRIPENRVKITLKTH